MDAVTLTWPGGEHAFALRMGELRALQQARDAGPEEVFNRLRTGRWHVDDLVHVIRLGLIGGGMDKAQAGPLVLSMMETHPLVQFKLTALEIVAHSLMGDLEDIPAGKPQAETGPDGGRSPTSTVPVQ